MLAPLIHILPLTTFRRERRLPVPGRVTAREDQKVTSLDIVADAHFGQDHVMIDVARSFGIQPEIAQHLIQVKAGETITKDQKIAQKAGLIPQIVHSPCNGRIVLVGSGRILMETGEGIFELRARIPGKVTRLIPYRGVEITFHGALVKGVWGNGQLGLGLMLPIVEAANGLLSINNIDVSLRGSILLAGYCNDPSTLQSAGELPVRGLILGGLSPALIPLAEKMQYPIVVVDGFGSKSMDSTAYKLLTSNAKREVTLNAENYNRQTGVRPEILIPLPVTNEPPLPREQETFAPDQTVRMTRAPHAGAVGTLVKLLPGLTTIPSGLRVASAEVRLESGELEVYPLANLEVLE
jgi:hypothetical protein